MQSYLKWVQQTEMALCREQKWEHAGLSFVFDWIKTQQPNTKRRNTLKLIPSQIGLNAQLNRSITPELRCKRYSEHVYKTHSPLTTLGGCGVVMKDTTSEKGPAPASLLAWMRNWYSVLSCSLLTLWDVEEPLNIVVKLKYDNNNWWLSMNYNFIVNLFQFAPKSLSDAPRRLKSLSLKYNASTILHNCPNVICCFWNFFL